MSGSKDIVAVDIGGTHARFAIATIKADGEILLGEPTTLHTEDHASFQTAWEDYQNRMGGSLPDALAMAVAGPIKPDVIRFTNNPWIIRPPLIESKLGCSKYTIINDFGAVAHAAARAPSDEFIHLAGPEGELPDTGTISVLGPGTGLGVAYFYRRPDGTYRVQATEGGHGDFAPVDAIEDAILARLRKRHTRVSDERVVSGPAIVDIYQALAAMEGRAVKDATDIEIWTAGTDGSDSLAAAAVDRFCLALGSVAGDIALIQGAKGVVIAGGLGYRIRETIIASGFASRFTAKGRFAGLMATLPVKLITHPQPGLLGAAAAFAQEHLGESRA
ncbi:glucokinase [Erythrobacter sp. F6033]|uniref:glucokinase n=1 Tax=Erythrobacter sp. F6033 TaxID=2926401 RepID=UPI001FF52EA8|nr:glucokinase [Erythrobacter sp. F6033]MCK0129190.1 glucokinase [Erythrobacter sp. F6033]